MDSAGYKSYLQLLGNQHHYIGYIQKLVELEHELSINLDDYIPYNDDYSKVDELNAVLPKDKLYDERLSFSINSYMRYRLSDFEINKAVEGEKSNKPICDDFFTFRGSAIELKSILSTFMSEADSQSFISSFKDLIPILGEGEFIKETISYPEAIPGILQVLIGSSNYNINIKAATLTTIALLLDIKLTLGFASSALAITGFNSQAIVRVNVSEGEKCLILEAMQSKNHIINEDVFSICNSECIHNDLDCKYQNDDKCTINKADIKRTLDELCDRNIFKRINGLYKYNF